jgi:hypothetical protein
LFKIEDARELAAIEAGDRPAVEDGDRNVLDAERPKLGEGFGIVFDVSWLEGDAALRKKLFRAGAGESAGAVINFDVHKNHSAAAFL